MTFRNLCGLFFIAYGFRTSALQQLKVENVIFIWQAGTISGLFSTVLALQEVRLFFFKFLIISYKKLYRKQSVEFPITEHIVLKIRPKFLKIEFF